jgi:hypothetical protein
MGIAVHCPGGHTLSIKYKYARKSGKCPRCGAKIKVPRRTPINKAFVESLTVTPSDSDVLNDVPDDMANRQSELSLLGPVSLPKQENDRQLHGSATPTFKRVGLLPTGTTRLWTAHPMQCNRIVGSPLAF